MEQLLYSLPPKLFGELFALTLEHMAEQANTDTETILTAIIAGGNARTRFYAYLQVGHDTLKKAGRCA